MSVTALGLAGAIGTVDKVIGNVDYLRRRAVLGVLGSGLVNYAKPNAPFKDQTHQLRQRMAHEILDQDYAGMEAPVLIFGNPMHYAIHVEAKNNLWVLSGAAEELRADGQLRDIVSKHMKAAGVKFRPSLAA